eukprot:2996849-Amphidinium_carterae.1
MLETSRAHISDMNVIRISEQAELEIPTLVQMMSSGRLIQNGLSLQVVPNVDVPRFNAWPFPMEVQRHDIQQAYGPWRASSIPVIPPKKRSNRASRRYGHGCWRFGSFLRKYHADGLTLGQTREQEGFAIPPMPTHVVDALKRDSTVDARDIPTPALIASVDHRHWSADGVIAQHAHPCQIRRCPGSLISQTCPKADVRPYAS